jgi:hypothetical protein
MNDNEIFKYIPCRCGLIIILHCKYSKSVENMYVKVPIAGWASNKDIQNVLELYGDDYEFDGVLLHVTDMREHLGKIMNTEEFVNNGYDGNVCNGCIHDKINLWSNKPCNTCDVTFKLTKPSNYKEKDN